MGKSLTPPSELWETRDIIHFSVTELNFMCFVPHPGRCVKQSQVIQGLSLHFHWGCGSVPGDSHGARASVGRAALGPIQP